MTEDEFFKLKPGDLVVFRVTGGHGLVNPPELVGKVDTFVRRVDDFHIALEHNTNNNNRELGNRWGRTRFDLVTASPW